MDQNLLIWINQGWAHPWLDVYFTWVSEKTYFSFPLLAIIVFSLSLRHKHDGLKLGLMFLLLIGFSDLLGNILKQILQLPRPCLDLSELIRQLGNKNPGCVISTTGMPSNHALNFFVALAFLGVILRKWYWLIPLAVVAISVAISRIYLGAHFPSQVLVGMLIGSCIGLLGAQLCQQKLPFVQRIQGHS